MVYCKILGKKNHWNTTITRIGVKWIRWTSSEHWDAGHRLHKTSYPNYLDNAEGSVSFLGYQQ